jgi:hypothetical protein
VVLEAVEDYAEQRVGRVFETIGAGQCAGSGCDLITRCCAANVSASSLSAAAHGLIHQWQTAIVRLGSTWLITKSIRNVRNGDPSLPEQIALIRPNLRLACLISMAGYLSDTTKAAGAPRAHQHRCACPGSLPPRSCSAGLAGKGDSAPSWPSRMARLLLGIAARRDAVTQQRAR